MILAHTAAESTIRDEFQTAIRGLGGQRSGRPGAGDHDPGSHYFLLLYSTSAFQEQLLYYLGAVIFNLCRSGTSLTHPES